MWSADAGDVLLPLARASIAGRLGLRTPQLPDPEPAWLGEPGASFVTLHRSGRLRGCIGTLETYRTIGADVSANAQAAAFSDPRFPALTAREYAGIDVEVSLLSPPEVMRWRTEAEVVEGVRSGVDGLVLEAGQRRGTFLPQVWEQLPEANRFVHQLKVKAGVGDLPWMPDWRISRYTVTAWAEILREA